jgi:hypothetical protein
MLIYNFFLLLPVFIQLTDYLDSICHLVLKYKTGGWIMTKISTIVLTACKLLELISLIANLKLILPYTHAFHINLRQ